MDVTRVEGDGIHSVLLKRSSKGESWGFRLSGGQDEGISLKLSKVALESPSGRAGLLPKDLLIAVEGEEVLDKSHEEVVRLIKGSSLELRLFIERGDNLIPSMSMLGRSGEVEAPPKSNFYLTAATEEILVPNSYRKKEKVFTTAGAPKIESDQYNKPMGLYSAETVARMADTAEIDPKLTGTGENQDRHFIAEQSHVLDLIIKEDEKMLQMGPSDCGRSTSDSKTSSRTNSRAHSLAPISRRGSLLPNPGHLPGMEPQSPTRKTHVVSILDEEDENRGMRKMSLVIHGEGAVLQDSRLAVSEGRYGDLGFKSIV